MPPRKSVGKAAPRKSQATTTAVAGASPLATSSKVTLDAIPPVEIPFTITPEYVPQLRSRQQLSESDREKLIHELVGFHPRRLCDDITEAARGEIYKIVDGIENWTKAITGETDDAIQREINIGLYTLETLLESHVDKAFDKFTAWALRNAFDVRAEYDVVLPWQHGLDFQRGEYIANLPQGEATLETSLEDLRTKVEQVRLLSQRLETAEEVLDRRLEIARQRKAEVGFIKEVLTASGLSPLPEKIGMVTSTLSTLHNTLSPLDIHTPTINPVVAGSAANPIGGGSTKAWELGRQAYLNWAVGKLVGNSPPGAGGAEPLGAVGGVTGEDILEVVERDMRESGGSEAIERITSA